MPQRAQASRAVSRGWLSCVSRVLRASSTISVMSASLHRLWVGKYSPPSKELSEEHTREEEIQAVADFAQWDIDEGNRTHHIHGNDERFIDESQSCYRYKERRQPDREVVVRQA